MVFSVPYKSDQPRREPLLCENRLFYSFLLSAQVERSFQLVIRLKYNIISQA